jgi:ComF family protein
MILRSYLSSFFNLLFPRLCQACVSSLVEGEDLICTHCLYNLPYTNFHLQADNTVARQFWGKVELQGAYAMLYFEKGGKVQQLMHRLKYRNVPEIGNKLGSLAATQLLQNPVFAGVEVIIPVPLHKSRLSERGYNQSAHISTGIAGKLKATVDERNLIRRKKTETQTHKSRFARFENMQEVFAVANAAALAGKHVLLVDDIVTTGSTLEACAMALLEVPGLKLSIAAMAYTA